MPYNGKYILEKEDLYKLSRSKVDLILGMGDLYEQISMAKRSSVKMASSVARKSRSILGGMGITSEYSIMRHLMNIETLFTYLGTEEIHTLITGRNITGISSFK